MRDAWSSLVWEHLSLEEAERLIVYLARQGVSLLELEALADAFGERRDLPPLPGFTRPQSTEPN